MATRYSPAIVTSGLVLCLDAANPRSYSGTGTTWTDLSGNGNNGTLVNSPTFSQGVFTFDGATNYINVSGVNFATGTSTIMGAARYNGATRGRIINGLNNNWLMGHWASTTENYYAEGWVSAVSSGTSDTNWRIMTSTSNTTSPSYSLYVNGTLSVSNTNGTAGPNGLRIGAYGLGGEFSTGQCGFVLAYNRILTAAEILQNYNATKSRFGL
jgi:hypothetical protein